MRAPIPLPRTARPAPMVPLASPQGVASIPYGAGSGVGVTKLSGVVTPQASSGQVSENVSRIDMGRIKRNVGRMAKLGAPAQEIDAYIASEGVTVEGVRAYREPDSKVNIPTDSLTGLGTQMGAALNRALLELTGGAVDRSRNVMNWGIAGANLLTGQKDLTTNMIRNAVGDSNSIAGGLEAVGMRDPRSIQPQTTGERIAAGIGEGIAYTVAPEMAFGAIGRLGAVPKQMQEMLTPLIGSGASPGAMATNAFAGGAAGAGAVVGGELAPEPFKPLASMVGGLAGGLGGAVAASVPGAVRAGGRAAANYVAPFSQSGRERLAGETLRDAATNPGAALRTLEAGVPELVPGSRPTTFQATGDMGLGALERGAATADPATFNQLRAEQNAARVAAVEGLQGAGSPEAVVTGLRNRLSEIDRQSEAAVSAALGRARGAVDDLGPGLTPEAAGETVRSRLEAARAAAKAQERALWGAVDPDGTLALGTANTKAAAKRLADETPAAAKQPEGEEAAILAVVRQWGDVVPFSEVTALQSRLKAAMREERFTKGESPTWRRLSILNDRLQADLEAVVASKGSDAAPMANSAPPGNGAIRQDLGRPGNGPFGPGSTSSGASGGILEAPRPELAPNFDPAALGRLNSARTATRQRVETFDNKTLGPLRRRPSTTAPYDVPTSAVMPRLFASGPRSVDAIATYRAAVGDDVALDAMAGYAIDRLRVAALREDGTLDPRKVETWLRSHADAMRAFPELRSRISNAAQSSEALAAEVVKRKAALDAEQSGALGRLIGAADPSEVVAIIGTTLGRGDAASQMMSLRLRLGKDKAALEGLRKAVVDHMVSRFVSNTEAGTSGVGTLKADAFQTFIKQKAAALRAAGFTDDEIARMVDVADDLQRANRSLSSVRIPGQSNTAQDLLAAKARLAAGSFLRKLVVGSALGGGAWMVTGPWVGAAVGISSAVVSALRASGVQQVDELVKDALLNPELARLLLSKVGPETERQISMTFAQRLRRAVLAGVFSATDDETSDKSGLDLVAEAMAARPAPSSKLPPGAERVAGALLERGGIN